MFSEAKTTVPIDLDGSMIIKRVINGWRVTFVGIDTGTGKVLQDYVYEDTTGETGNAEALQRLLYEHFAPYMQSKYKGGLVIEHHEQGREIDNAAASE